MGDNDRNNHRDALPSSPRSVVRLYNTPSRLDTFVHRPAEYDRIRELLFKGTGAEAVAITTALHGAGGLGKTTLAQAIFHDSEIQQHFPDGMYWVTLGKTPDIDLEKKRIFELLMGDPDTRELDAKLKAWLKGKAFLFVIDDVWEISHLYPILNITREAGIKCLFTTRIVDIAEEAGGEFVPVDLMKPAEALQVLSQGVTYRPEHETALKNLTERLSNWPLLLKLAGGMLRRRLRRKESLTRTLDALYHILMEKGVTAFDSTDPKSRDEAIGKTINLSLEELSPVDRERYFALAIVPEDTDVPLVAAAVLWRTTERSAEESLLAQDSLALLKLDLGLRTFRLHDVFLDYLMHQTTDLPGLHRRIIEAYLARCDGVWAQGADDGYFFGHLIYHLLAAGQVDEARSALLDYDWIQSRLEAVGADASVNIYATIADYELWLKAVQITDDEREDHPGFAPRMVRDALLKSSHILAVSRKELANQLPAQLGGRLMVFKDKDLCRLREQAERPIHPPRWLIIPKTHSLTQAGGSLVRTLEGHTDWINAVATFDNNGVPMAVSGSTDKTIRLWNLRNGQAEGEPLKGHTHWVNSLAVFRYDGVPMVISASCDRTLRLWNLRTGQAEGEPLQGHAGWVNTVAVFEHNGVPMAISGSDDWTLRLWNLRTRQAEGEPLKGHTNWVSAVVVFECDGVPMAISASKDTTLRLWNLRTGQAQGEPLQGHTSGVNTVAIFECDGVPMAISGSNDGTLRRWNLRTSQAEGEPLHGYSENVHVAAVFKRDGVPIAISASRDTILRLWNLYTGHAEEETMQGHTSGVNAINVFECYGVPMAVSASRDKTLRLWNLRANQTEGEPLQGHTSGVNAIAVFECDGVPMAVSSSDGGTLRRWNLRTSQAEGEPLREYSGSVHTVVAFAHDPLFIGLSWENLWILNLRTVQPERKKLEVNTGGVNAMTGFQLDGAPMIVLAANDKTLRLLNLRTGQAEGQPLKGHTDRINVVAVFERDNVPMAISGSDDGSLRLWNLRTGQADGEPLQGHTGKVIAIAILDRGKVPMAISASSDRTLRLWNLRTGQAVGEPLRGHTDWINDVTMFLQNGVPMAISVSHDRSLRLWDLATHACLSTFTGDASLQSVAISPDIHPGEFTIIAGESSGRIHFLKLLDRDTVKVLRHEKQKEDPIIMPNGTPQPQQANERHFNLNEARECLSHALIDMGLLRPGEHVPEPYDEASGVMGRSCVWFLCIPRGGGVAQELVAKFDEPERAAKEWKAITQLRRLGAPLQAILPLGKNEERHGVIIYQNIASQTLTGKIITLKKLLRQQLNTRPEHCVKALDDAFKVLRLFYSAEPGAARMATEAGEVIRWRDSFPAILRDKADILQGFRRAWDSLDMNTAHLDIPELGQYPNPFHGLESRLEEMTGRVMLSRVHGDLNLTNIMSGLDGAYAVDGVFIIDLANCREEAPTALDLARLESEFWHEVFTQFTRADSTEAETQCLREMIESRAWLDGRTVSLPVGLAPLARNAAKWVMSIRQEALSVLRGNQPAYCMEDYMRALYFSHTRALGFSSVQDFPNKCRAALLGAALSLQFIQDLEAGLYLPPNGSRERPILYSELPKQDIVKDRKPVTSDSRTDLAMKQTNPINAPQIGNITGNVTFNIGGNSTSNPR